MDVNVIVNVLSRKLGAAVVLSLIALSAAAQPAFPSRPVKIIVPYPAGGPSDLLARLAALEFGKLWPQNVIVENRAGAGGTIGTDAVAKAAPDGHTLLWATMAANAVAPSIYAKLPYDPLKDFAYISGFTRQASVLLVNASVPANTLKELIEYTRANKGKTTYASPGIGLSGHLGMELILRAAGMEVLHVPYKGSAPASLAMSTGETQMTLDLVPGALNYLKSGKAKAIAISSEGRSTVLPEVPTLSEALGRRLAFSTWQGMAAPTGTPPEIIAKIFADLQTILKQPEMRERLARIGAEPYDLPPEQFTQLIRDEAKRWGDIVRAAGIRIE